MSTTRFVSGLAIVGLAASLSACGGDAGSTVAEGCEPAHEFTTIEEGVLTVGIYDLPPFISTSGDGGMSGVDADIIREIAEKECLEVTPETLTTAAMVPAVENGRIDVALGDWYRTEARAEVVSLSDPLYLDQMGIVSADGLATISDLEGLRVGGVDGYLWTADMQAALGDNFVLYPSGTNMYQDLEAGRIDVGTDSYASAVEVLGEDSDLQVAVAEPDDAVAATQQPGQTCFPLPKDNEALVTAINEDVAELRESGRLVEILESHGVDASAADVGEPRLI